MRTGLLLLLVAGTILLAPVKASRNDPCANKSKKITSVSVVDLQWCYVETPLVLTIIVILLVVFQIFYHHFHLLSEYIPESCCLIIIGLLVGCFFLPWPSAEQFLSFDARTFFMYILPPIILEAAYSLKDRAFNDNVGTILLYAVVGTIFNAVLCAIFLYLISYTGWFGDLNFIQIFVWCSLIAAVDPVAVLAIFQEVGVNKMLYFMVFGESLLNDAVTIVLYNVALEFAEVSQVRTIDAVDFFTGVAAFLCVSLGGCAFGIICGFLGAFMSRYLSGLRVLEPVVLYATAYLSYCLSEMVDWSGIVAIVCCGLIQANYAFDNISSKSYVATRYTTKVAAGVMEAIIFVILGVMLVNDDSYWEYFNWKFSLIALFIVFVVRFIVTFTLTMIVNKHTEGLRKISFNEQIIMGYGGLRGAICFSLAFSIGPDVLGSGWENRDMLLGATYVVILFTVFVQGSTMKLLVSYLKIRLAGQLEGGCYRLFIEFNHGTVNNMVAGIEEIVGIKGTNYWTQLISHTSHKYVRPMLQKEEVRHFKHGGLVETHEELQLKEQHKAGKRQPSMRNNERILDSHMDFMDETGGRKDAILATPNNYDDEPKGKQPSMMTVSGIISAVTPATATLSASQLQSNEPSIGLPQKYKRSVDIKRASDIAYIQSLIRNAPQNKLHYKSIRSLADSDVELSMATSRLNVNNEKVSLIKDAEEHNEKVRVALRKITMELNSAKVSTQGTKKPKSEMASSMLASAMGAAHLATMSQTPGTTTPGTPIEHMTTMPPIGPPADRSRTTPNTPKIEISYKLKRRTSSAQELKENKSSEKTIGDTDSVETDDNTPQTGMSNQGFVVEKVDETQTLDLSTSESSSKDYPL